MDNETRIILQEIKNQKELMQDDILCILYGINDQDLLNNVCQVIDDRMNILKAVIKGSP